MRDIKTKKINFINDKILLVTVDISKDSHFGYCVAPNGQEVKPFKFSNDRSGFNSFWNKILIAKNRFKLDKVIFGFESTSVYAEPLVHFLTGKPIRIVQVSPMHTKRVKELVGNSPNKTDRKDPRVIADIIRLGRFLSVIVPQGSAACLRQLSHARERKVCARTSFINQLEHLVSRVFPEFPKILGKITGKTAQYLLKNYGAPGKFSFLDNKELGTAIRKISRGRFKEEKASKLISAAQRSIGINEGLQAMVMEIKQLIEQIELCDKFIKDIEKEMKEELEKVSLSSNLLSIKGLGIVSVSGIIGEVGDFEKFGSQKEIIKLAGLNLFERSSGKFQSRHRISKRGRSLLRKLLYFASINMIKKNGIMHDYYQKLLDRGVVKTKALVAVSRKLLRLVFAIARDKSEYIVDYSVHSNYELKKAA